MSRKISDCVPELQEAWYYGRDEWQKRYSSLPVPFLTCTFRSNTEQGILYKQGRTKPGAIVTWAKPGNSPHNFTPSYAFDVAFLTPQKTLDWDEELFRLFADILKERQHVEWGGNWARGKKDFPHFQIKNWRKLLTAK